MEYKKSLNKLFISLPVPIILLALWEVLSRNGFFDVSILPPPSLLFNTFWEMLKSKELLEHAMVSVLRVFEGFSIGSILAITLGIALGFSSRLEESMSLIIGVFKTNSSFSMDSFTDFMAWDR